jgi:hypothetical protein
MTLRLVCATIAATVALAACSRPDPAGTATGASSRIAKLHTAAQCLRAHGIANFADPVLSASGEVFTDARPLQDAPESTINAAQAACSADLQAANWSLDSEPPAPAAMVAAGVRSAQCLRANGLPHITDPTAASPYTPGHGFGLRGDELPPGADKRSPIVQHAFGACRSILDAEIQASRLSNLSGK